ncbi:MAG: hypothetical protein U0441_06860 [Polyangiaceae bacterium]
MPPSNGLSRSLCAALLPCLLVACGESSGEGTGGSTTTSTTTSEPTTTTDTTTSTVDPDAPWSFATAAVDGLPPVWGAAVAQASPEVAYLVGGVKGTSGPVAAAAYKIEQGSSGVTVTTVSEAVTARFCGCAMVDEKRGELITLGGRGKDFTETPTAEIIALATGEVTPLDAGEAAAHPVGCHAVFLPDRDEGYVFGGAAQADGFDGRTWRYSPSDRSLTLLDGAGPPARYDGVMRYPVAGGSVWLVAGMGISAGKAKFYSDVWRLDPAAGTWTEAPANGDAPKGRRIPWVAFTADAGTLVMGMGSDSAQGQTMVDDLWRFDTSTGVWTTIEKTGDLIPPARGFAPWLPGPEGSAGMMSGGLQDLGAAKDVLIFQPPVPGSFR